MWYTIYTGFGAPPPKPVYSNHKGVIVMNKVFIVDRKTLMWQTIAKETARPVFQFAHEVLATHKPIDFTHICQPFINRISVMR